VKPNINSVQVHPQPSKYKGHPVNGELVRAGSLGPEKRVHILCLEYCNHKLDKGKKKRRRKKTFVSSCTKNPITPNPSQGSLISI